MSSKPSAANDDEETSNIPKLLQFWRTLQASLPRIEVFGLNISLTLATSIAMSIVRFTAEYVMVHVFGWPDNSLDTKLAAASCGSITHSLNLVPALATLFATHPYRPSESLTDAPLWWRESVSAMLQFCTGYMLYDSLLNIIWLKLSMGLGSLSSEDYMFLGHHVATVLYMSSTRWMGAGHQSAMICMFLGELTNPLHNSYYIAIAAQKFDCCNGSFSQAAFAVIEFWFGLSYFIMRAIVAPPFFIHLTYVLWFRRNKLLPIWLIATWTLLVWGVELGSIPWIYDCWSMVEKRLPESVVAALGRSGGGEL